MSKERKVLKGKDVKTGLFYVNAMVKGTTVYTTLIEAPDKFKAAVIFHKRAVAGKLTDYHITPKMTTKDLKVEYRPVKSLTLSEMMRIQKSLNGRIFPTFMMN